MEAKEIGLTKILRSIQGMKRKIKLDFPSFLTIVFDHENKESPEGICGGLSPGGGKNV